MKRKPQTRVLLLLAAAAALVGGGAAGAPPKIDARAGQYLKQMSTFLAGLQTFSVTAQEHFDETTAGDELIQVSNERRLTVRRPDRLAAEATGDTANRRVYYDGKTLTLLDRKNNVYAVTPVPGTIDAMFDRMFQQYGVSQPLADLVFADPYRVLTERVQSGRYVGEHQVGGETCHHLAFRQTEIDWQIWIAAGDRPLPRQLLILYKKAPGSPRYMATLDGWKLNPDVAPDTFTFTAPPGAARIEFIPRAGSAMPGGVSRRK